MNQLRAASPDRTVDQATTIRPTVICKVFEQVAGAHQVNAINVHCLRPARHHGPRVPPCRKQVWLLCNDGRAEEPQVKCS